MNAIQLSKIALEVWRASGAKTIERLDALVTMYAESYIGSASRWTADQAEEISRARELAKAGVRGWELAK